jgi:hypothetical protein
MVFAYAYPGIASRLIVMNLPHPAKFGGRALKTPGKVMPGELVVQAPSKFPVSA